MKDKSVFDALDGKGRSSPVVLPFVCDDERLIDFVGDILAQAVRDYVSVGRRLKDLELEKKLRYYDKEISWERKRTEEDARYAKAVIEYKEKMAVYGETWEKVHKARIELIRELEKDRHSESSIYRIVGRKFPFPEKPKKPKLAVIPKPNDMLTPFYYTQKSALDAERNSIRAFFLGESYTRFSTFPGNEVLNELDGQIEKYKPKAMPLKEMKNKKRKGENYEVYQD